MRDFNANRGEILGAVWLYYNVEEFSVEIKKLYDMLTFKGQILLKNILNIYKEKYIYIYIYIYVYVYRH